MQTENQKLENLQREIIISTLLLRGQEQHLASPLSCCQVSRDEVTGGLTGNIQGYVCFRCQKNFGFILMTPAGASWFCGNYDCLQEDKEYSLSINSKIKKTNTKDASEVFFMGSRYYNACLAKCKLDQQSIQAISEWLKQPKNMVILLGLPGTGKTYFCAAIANYFLEKSVPVYYTNVRRFIESIQKNINEGKNQYEGISKISDIDNLILDDLGASYNTEWQQDIFLDLIDRRYSNNKPTIITSNLSFPEINDCLGPRIERRLNNKSNLIITAVDVFND